MSLLCHSNSDQSFNHITDLCIFICRQWIGDAQINHRVIKVWYKNLDLVSTKYIYKTTRGRDFKTVYHWSPTAPLPMNGRPYNSLALPCERVILSELSIISGNRNLFTANSVKVVEHIGRVFGVEATVCTNYVILLFLIHKNRGCFLCRFTPTSGSTAFRLFDTPSILFPVRLFVIANSNWWLLSQTCIY